MLLIRIVLGVGCDTVVKSLDCGKLGNVLHCGGIESEVVLTEGDNAVSLPLVVVLTPITSVEEVKSVVRISGVVGNPIVVICVNGADKIGVYVERICAVLVFDKPVYTASCPACKTIDRRRCTEHILFIHDGTTVYIGVALFRDRKIVVDRPGVVLNVGIGKLNVELLENALVEDYKVSISDSVHRDVAGGDERLVCDLQGFLSTRCPVVD